MKNRPIDKIRDSALSITLSADTGGIIDMGEINGALYMIGCSAIYRVQLADEIDPRHRNIAIGARATERAPKGSVLRSRVSLRPANFDNGTAAFQHNVLKPAFDYKTGINLFFEALQDLAAMHGIRKDVRARFDMMAEDLKNLAVKQPP